MEGGTIQLMRYNIECIAKVVEKCNQLPTTDQLTWSG